MQPPRYAEGGNDVVRAECIDVTMTSNTDSLKNSVENAANR